MHRMGEGSGVCLDLPSVDAINTFIVSKAVNTHGFESSAFGLGR